MRIGAHVKPGDILVGNSTPKGDTELVPEEKLLKAAALMLRYAQKPVKPVCEIEFSAKAEWNVFNVTTAIVNEKLEELRIA